MTKKLIFAIFVLILTGCSRAETEIINFSNIFGDFIISAPADFVYQNHGEYGIFIIGTEDGNDSIMVFSIQKTDFESYGLAAIASEYEERLVLGFEITQNHEIIENSQERLIKSFEASIDGENFLIYLAYIEFLDEYYIIHITSATRRRSIDFQLDSINSFERRSVARGMFDFFYSDDWIPWEEFGIPMLVHSEVGGMAVIIPTSMEEDLGAGTPEEYMEIAKSTLQEIYYNQGFFIINTEFKEINGEMAGVIEYRYVHDDEGTIISRQMFILRDGVVYVLTYRAHVEFYDRFLNEVIEMENSFVILN